MVDVEKMSDAELRAELTVRGENVGPVTGTTRSLYEKKLKKLIAAGGKTPSRPAAAKPAVVKPTPKAAAAAKITTPAKPPVVKPKTPEPTRTAASRRSMMNSSQSSQNSTFSRSEVEELSDSDVDKDDDDDYEDEEEILSPRSKNVIKRPVGRPVSSTPTKKLSPKAPLSRPTPPAPASTSRVSTTINTTTRIPTTPRNTGNLHVPNLITEFTPSFSTFGSDRPGATPPRNRIPASSIYSTSKVLQDLGNTTGEESDGGIESSRIIYKSKGPQSQGIVKNAWNKVLGYGFTASKNPGDSYELRAGASRIRVAKNPRTGKVSVAQSNRFNDAVWVALYAILIAFVVLLVAWVLTSSEPTNLKGTWTVVKASVKDSINFFYNYAILPVVSIALVILLGAGLYFGLRKYKETNELEEAKLYDLIERITELIKESAADGDPYVSQPHVRDVIFPPAKRRSAEMTRWEKAVEFIDQHESRVATDVMLLASGNECAVWKWIGNQSQKRW